MDIIGLPWFWPDGEHLVEGEGEGGGCCCLLSINLFIDHHNCLQAVSKEGPFTKCSQNFLWCLLHFKKAKKISLRGFIVKTFRNFLWCFCISKKLNNVFKWVHSYNAVVFSLTSLDFHKPQKTILINNKQMESLSIIIWFFKQTKLSHDFPFQLSAHRPPFQNYITMQNLKRIKEELDPHQIFWNWKILNA